MMRPDLQAIAAKWIRLFRIQNRIITVSYVPNLVNPSTGDVVYALMSIENDDEGRYSIYVQDPATWPTDAMRPMSEKSIENAVRHECAHIMLRDFAPRNPSDADILAEERAVWAISDAFDLINEGNAPQFAAMVARQLDRKPQTFSQIAGNVRAMVARQKATAPRLALAGRKNMIDAATAKQILDALQSEDVEAMKTALRGIVEAALSGGDQGPPSVPDPNAPPMGADAGPMDPNKDKTPTDAMRSMAAGVDKIRGMVAETATLRDEVKAAAEILRPQAKLEIVRAMKAEGIVLTSHAEKLIVDAPTIEAAKDRAATVRAMAPVGTKRPQVTPPTHSSGIDTAGLTPGQLTSYNRYMRAGKPDMAARFVETCAKTNATRAQNAGKGK